MCFLAETIVTQKNGSLLCPSEKLHKIQTMQICLTIECTKSTFLNLAGMHLPKTDLM